MFCILILALAYTLMIGAFFCRISIKLENDLNEIEKSMHIYEVF
jgi:hypothetical protein